MRSSLKIVLVTLFCFGTLINFSVVYGSKNDIKLDKENGILIASKAFQYKWFLNGVEIFNNQQTLRVNTTGTYKVVMIDENGELKNAYITVGLNAEGEVYRIFLIGDSTVCYYSSGAITGWGMMLPYFFDSTITIHNRAVAGTSAKSFYNDFWSNVIDDVDSGDFVFIGFGINDNQSQNPEKYTLPFEGFQDYLTLYAEETKAKGAFPVIVTTTRKNNFINDTTVSEYWGDYPVASRQLAYELDLPLIDIDSVSKPFYESLGYDYLHSFVYMDDNTHFQESGAVEIARIVAQEISKYSGDDTMNLLIPHLKPLKKVATSTNFPELATITRTASYPEGIPVNLKVIYPDTLDLLEWQYTDDNSTFAYMAATDLYRFSMGTDSLDLLAFIDDDPQPDCHGTFNGLAYLDDCGECVGGESNRLPCNMGTSDGVYKLTSVRSGYCIQGGDTSTQELCINDDLQFWEIIKEGNYYKIKNLGTGEYLGYSALESNTLIKMDPSEVLWRMEKFGTDTFGFNLADSTDLSMEVYKGSTRLGKPLRIYKRTNLAQQQFILWELNPDDCSGYPCVDINSSVINDFNFDILPNPASGQANLILSSIPEKPFAINIYDLQGKIVFHKSNIIIKNLEFGNELSKGLYIVKVIKGKHVYTRKFIKY